MQELKQILREKDPMIIDVRAPWEYEMEHIPGASNIPLDIIRNHVAELKENLKPVVVYCRSGARSAMAQAILQQSGLKAVYNGGGIEDMKIYFN